MLKIRPVFDFYIYSNIHVALAAFSFTKITLMDFGIHDNITPAFTFFATVISYNFIRGYKIDEIDIFSSSWMKAHKRLLILLNLISAVLLLYLTFKIHFSALLMLIPFALTTFFYIVPFHVKKKNLRSIASLKLFLIAVTWAGITVLFPLVQHRILLSSLVWIIFVQRILFLVANTIPFDIRDKDDDHIGLNTLPQVLGVRKSKIFGALSVLIFFVLEFFKIPLDRSLIIKIAVLSLVTLLFLLFSTENRNRYYTMFWIEAIPIFWLILMFL